MGRIKVQKNQKVKERGITLIALVITIIVLLILAGVALATLTGDSGILSNAENAKRQTQKANAKEQVQLAIQGALVEGLGKVTYDSLDKELKNVVQGTYSIEETGEGTWTVTVNGYKFQVTETGSIQEISGISLSQVKVEIAEGENLKLTATLTEGIAGAITWTSSDENVATVTDGTVTAVTAVAGGTATIIASITSDGETYEAKCQVKVVSKVTEITITETTLELILRESKQLTLITTPSINVESLTYTSSDTSVVTVDGTGKVTAKGKGEATITVAGKTSTDVKATCTVTVTIPESAPIGDYVIYNVSYTDMYSDIDSETDGLQGYEFGPEDGWRILDGGISNGDGTYSNVKLISTGIPARLYYNYKTNAGKANNEWWGDAEQVARLYDTEEVKYSEAGYDYNGGYPHMFAAAGLLENFTLIPFSAGISATENKGYFNKINSVLEGELPKDAFLAKGASKVHNLTLEELNTARGYTTELTSTTSTKTKDAATGLFYLKNLGSKFGYSSTDPSYWCGFTSKVSSVLYIAHGNGTFYHNAVATSGVRPVVSLSTKIQKNDTGNWEIVP